MTTLFLLSTQGCHLCDEAEALLVQVNTFYEVVDIVEDDNLVSVYGDKIPVLIAQNAEQALFWPFNLEQINQYKEYYGIS